MYDILELNKKLVSELRDIAKNLQIKRVEKYKKEELQKSSNIKIQKSINEYFYKSINIEFYKYRTMCEGGRNIKIYKSLFIEIEKRRNL